MRALVLAADPEQLAALGQALESVGLRVELLADAAAARRRLASSTPDLVVMDARGPQLALFEVYEALRESLAGASVPVIFARYAAEQVDHDGPDHYLPTSSDAAAVAALAGELLDLPEPGVVVPGDAADRPAPATPREQPATGGVGRVLELLLLMVGVVLLLVGGAIVLLRRDTLPPLVVPPTAVPATAVPRASPAPAFGVLPAAASPPLPSPSPTP